MATPLGAGPVTTYTGYTAEPGDYRRLGCGGYQQIHIKNPEAQGGPAPRAISSSYGTNRWVNRYTLNFRNARQRDINSEEMGQVRSRLQEAETAGIQLIIMANYDADGASPNDTTLAWSRRHIEQLAPLFHEWQHVICAFTFPFYGKWGEQHSSSNGHNSTTADRNNYVNGGGGGNATSSSGKAIWDHAIAHWPASRPLLCRFAGVKRTHMLHLGLTVNPTSKQDIIDNNVKARIGMTNDAYIINMREMLGLFGYNETDAYYQAAYQYWYDDTRYSITTGEPEHGSDQPVHQFTNARDVFRKSHCAALNENYNRGVHDQWGSTNEAAMYREMGYRPRLTSSGISSSTAPGETFTLNMSVYNDGMTVPWLSGWKVDLILRNKATGALRPPLRLNVFPRVDWEPKVTHNFTQTLTLPANTPTGDYEPLIYIHEDLINSKSEAVKDKYAMWFANAGGVRSGRYNKLNHTMTVSGTAVEGDTTPPPAPTLSLASGTYTSAQQLTMLSSETGAQIRWTSAVGTSAPPDPQSTSQLYNAAIPITQSVVIKAAAFDAAGNRSTVVQRNYTIQTATDPNPNPQPGAGPGYEPKVYPYSLTESENTKVPAGWPLDAASATVRQALINGAAQNRPLWSDHVRIYNCAPTDEFYSVIQGGNPWLYNGQPVRWRCPSNAVNGGGTDAPLLLQDELGNGVFPAQTRLRGWQVTIDHTAKTLSASNFSVHKYSRDGFVEALHKSGPATGSNREWIGAIRPQEVAWGLQNGGTRANPNVANLKAAIPHTLRCTLDINMHSGGFRAPATISDAGSGRTGPVQMGMRLKLAETLTDAQILARVPSAIPAGFEEQWHLTLWMLLFAMRDYGISVADTVNAPGLMSIQTEQTPEWTTLLGSGNKGEIFRSAYSNATLNNPVTRAANAGIPYDEFVVPSASVYPITSAPTTVALSGRSHLTVAALHTPGQVQVDTRVEGPATVIDITSATDNKQEGPATVITVRPYVIPPPPLEEPAEEPVFEAKTTIGDSLYEAMRPVAFTESDPYENPILLGFCRAIGATIQPLDDLVRDEDDGTVGWSILFDVDRVPAPYLPYLAQFSGVRITKGLDPGRTRRRIRESAGMQRGTLASILNNAKRYLSGSKQVIHRERDAGRAYRLYIATYAQETPDALSVLRAINEVKPAGIRVHYEVIGSGLPPIDPDEPPPVTNEPATGLTYGRVAQRLDNYTTVKNVFSTYDGLRTAKLP